MVRNSFNSQLWALAQSCCLNKNMEDERKNFLRHQLFVDRMRKIIDIEKNRDDLGELDRNSDLLAITEPDSLSMECVEIFEELQRLLRTIADLPDESFSVELSRSVFEKIAKECAEIVAKVVRARSSNESPAAKHFLDWMRGKVGQITMAQFLLKNKKEYGRNLLKERLVSLTSVAL